MAEPSDPMLDAGVAFALQASVHGQGSWTAYVRALWMTMEAARLRALTAGRKGGRVIEPLPIFNVEREEIAKITLCGSTKFRSEFELWNKRLTLAGFLVYSVSGFGHSGDTFTDEEKARLDQVHLAKIAASHAIVVINPDGYIGDSTHREIEYARESRKPVYYTHDGRTVYQLRTGPDGPSSLRYRAFSYGAPDHG